MEISAKNVTENDLPAASECMKCAPDGVVDKSEEMPSQLVNSTGDKDVSGEKTGEDTRSQLHDGVKYEWMDITSDFISACSSLELGELVHDSKYGFATDSLHTSFVFNLMQVSYASFLYMFLECVPPALNQFS